MQIDPKTVCFMHTLIIWMLHANRWQIKMRCSFAIWRRRRIGLAFFFCRVACMRFEHCLRCDMHMQSLLFEILYLVLSCGGIKEKMRRIDSATQQWQLKCVRWGAGTQNIAFSKFVQILRILVAYNWQTKTPPRNRFLSNENIWIGWCFCYDKNIEMRNVRSMFSIVTNGE